MDGPVWDAARTAGICLVLGISFTVQGLLQWRGTGRFVAGAKRADGVVVDRATRTHVSEPYVHPVVKFETPDGGTVTFEDPVGTDLPLRIGRRVAVLYDPRDPQRARIRSSVRLWLLPTVMVMLGAVALVAGLVSAAVGVFLFFATGAR